VRGLRIGVATNLVGMDADSRATLDGAIATLAAAGGSMAEVVLPPLDEPTMQWLSLCGVEAALAHEKTYPARAAEYGPVLAGLLDAGRKLSALDLARLELGRARLVGELNRLMATVDLLLMPVMGIAALSVASAASRTPDGVATRLRYTAPFDMSGHPTLTLPGGFTADGVPVGFQIVGRAFDEAAILTAGHAYQSATDWHLRRPPV
jgi:amidase